MKHPRASLFLTTSWNLFLKSPRLTTQWIYDLLRGPWVSQTIHPALWGSEGLQGTTQAGQPRFMSWLNCKLMVTFSRYLWGVHLGRCSFYRHKVEFPEAGIPSAMCILQELQTLLSHHFFSKILETWRNDTVLCRWERKKLRRAFCPHPCCIPSHHSRMHLVLDRFPKLCQKEVEV